ncbi:MAG: hypothetical protein IV090_21850 [Candidatus Sericytochromatia bacterium]|nr:hypothetical protein [Candidatus Sericytochromatia bacterium]
MFKITALAALTALCFGVSLPAWASERAAVLDFSSKGNITASDASIITDRIRSLIVQSQKYEVIERENMDRILREQGFQATQNCDTTDCSVAIGKILSVRHMITGSASRLGNLYSLNLRIIDVEKGSILKEEYVDCLCPLESLMTQTAPELVRKVLNNAKAVDAKPATSAEVVSGLPVREAKPWLIFLEGGWPRYASVGAFYHFGPYFALGASAGVTTGSFTISPHMALAPRVYFNPHDLAGFLELVAVFPMISFNSISFKPRLGFEYRNPSSGLSFGMAVGPNIVPFGYDPTIFDATAMLGYAF